MQGKIYITISRQLLFSSKTDERVKNSSSPYLNRERINFLRRIAVAAGVESVMIEAEEAIYLGIIE